MLSTYAKLLQWPRYFGVCSTQVPHTYSLSQLLPSHVCLSSNRPSKRAQIDVYTLGLEIRLVLCSQLVPNCFNDRGILDYALHRYPTHIRSPDYCHRMRIGQAIDIENALKLSFVHSDSGIDCCDALNLCQTASMMWVLWIMLYTGTPHIFALQTTAITCVFGKQ
jgi:hypothetical protein